MNKEELAFYTWTENWYYEYSGLQELREQSVDTRKWLVDIIDRFSYVTSMVLRYDMLSKMMYIVRPRKTEYTTTVFRVTRSVDGDPTTAQFAYLYSWKDDTVHHEYFCISPTFLSADGEYRHRFVPFSSLQRGYDKAPEHMKAIEQHVLDQMRSGEIEMSTKTILPRGADPGLVDEVETSINTLDLVVKMYSASWIFEYNRLRKEIYENHLHPNYHQVMFSEHDTEFWKAREDLFGSFSSYADTLEALGSVGTTVEVGQKIMPLAVAELEQIRDIRLAVWREIYIASRVGDLVVNCITPGVPVLCDWFLLPNHPDLYENWITHSRLEQSGIAREIVEEIEKSRSRTYTLDDEGYEHYISSNMAQLSSTMWDPIDYAERRIVLSDYALVSLVEHTGRTISDQPRLLMSGYMRARYGDIFRTRESMARLMFGYLYTLYNLNTKLGVIHGDLHANNITVFTLGEVVDPVTKIHVVQNAHIIFKLLNTEYIFSSISETGSIIDFSRSFIWNSQMTQDFSPVQMNNIQDDIITRLQHTIRRELPEWYDQHSYEIGLLMRRNFTNAYQVFQALDAHRLSVAVVSVIKTELFTKPERCYRLGGVVHLEQEILPLLYRIRDMAYDFIVKYFDLLMSGSTTTIPNPNLLIIQSLFQEFELSKFTPRTDITLIDFYNSNNELKYNLRNPEQVPDIMLMENLVKRAPKAMDARISRYKEMQEYNAEHDPEQTVTAIQEEAAAEHERLHGKHQRTTTRQPQLSTSDSETAFLDVS